MILQEIWSGHRRDVLQHSAPLRLRGGMLDIPTYGGFMLFMYPLVPPGSDQGISEISVHVAHQQ